MKPLLGITLFLCVGCGFDPFARPARLAVNDDLRSACAGWFDTDEEIELYLDSVDLDRSRGFSREQILTYDFQLCSQLNSPVTAPCMTCAIAVVTQVFGY